MNAMINLEHKLNMLGLLYV